MTTTGASGPSGGRAQSAGDAPRRADLDLHASTLLLVEDDLGDRRLFEEQLRAGGLRCQVVAAGSASEAVDVLQARDDIDLVLLDLGLPDSQGLETIDRVSTETPDVPVIVLTGRSDDPEVAVDALRRGAHDYLVKGQTGAGELARAIRYALERHDLQQRSSTQLLHQTALHQLEIASTTAADLQSFVRSAAGALQVGLAARRVTLRLTASTLPGAAAATAVDPSSPDRPDPDDDVTSVPLTGTAGPLGTLTVAVPANRPLSNDQHRFLTAAAASIVGRVERIAASMALMARTRQLGTVQRVAEQLQRTRDPADAVTCVAELLADGAGLDEQGQVRVEVGRHTATAGADASPQSVLEAAVTVRGEDIGTVQLLRHEGDAWGPEEQTMLDGVTAQLNTWWALSLADQEHHRDLDRIMQLMETAPVGLALIAANGRVRFANAAALDLVGAESVAQFPWQFHGEAVLDPALTAVAEVRRTGKPVRDVNVSMLQPDGTQRVLSVNASPLAPSPAGRGMALAVSDVTAERRRAVLLETALDREQQSAEEMRRVGELKDGFLRAVSHELRTPLASIFGFAETLRDHGLDLDSDQRLGMLERLHANAQRLALLLEDLLDVGRITAGVRSAPALREVDLANVVTAIIDLLPHEGRTIDLDLEPTPAHVEPAKVERIVHNLLGNVVRHTPEGTVARVATRSEGDTAVLVVEDDGPGIPAAEREQMFEPFVQGPQASAAASPGTGVGLSLVRQFVDLHGGSIELDTSPMGGARFTIRFPSP